MNDKIDYLYSWFEFIGDYTIPPFCVELVLRDGERYFLHSISSKEENNNSYVFRIWDLRALNENDIEELKNKISKIKKRKLLDDEKSLNAKLDWGNLRIHINDILYCVEWHDRLWPESKRPKIGFSK